MIALNDSMALLTSEEKSELTKLESDIKHGLGQYVIVGTALLRIRDGKLHRATHATFDAYCRERWDFGRTYAHRLIDAAGIVVEISRGVKNVAESATPATEFVARPLGELPSTEQKSAWKEAVKTAPKGTNGQPNPTAKHVAKVVAQRIAEKIAESPEPPDPPADEWPVDEVGQAIPDEYRTAFEARQKFDTTLNLLRQINTTINPLMGDADKVRPIAGGEHLAEQRQIVLRDIKNVRAMIKATRPHAVCPYCKGTGKCGSKPCTGCVGIGWVCERTYTVAPPEMKAKTK